MGVGGGGGGGGQEEMQAGCQRNVWYLLTRERETKIRRVAALLLFFGSRVGFSAAVTQTWLGQTRASSVGRKERRAGKTSERVSASLSLDGKQAGGGGGFFLSRTEPSVFLCGRSRRDGGNMLALDLSWVFGLVV